MDFEAPFLEKQNKEDELEQKETKPSRRTFLKKMGIFLSGAAVAGSSIGEVLKALEPRKIEGSKFDWIKLHAEIEKIHREHKERWKEEIRRRLRKGIETNAKIFSEKLTSEHVTTDFVALGAFSGATAGMIKELIRENWEGREPEIHGVEPYVNLGAAIGLIFDKIIKAAAEKSPELSNKLFKEGVEEAAFRALDVPQEKKTKADIIDMGKFEQDLGEKISDCIRGQRKYLVSEANITDIIEQWGAASLIVIYELLRTPQPIDKTK